MKKSVELTDPSSCFRKAELDEYLFVILERDKAAPATIRFWISERIRLGLNKLGDGKLSQAEWAAAVIESKQPRAA